MNETTNEPKINKSKLILAAFKVKGIEASANEIVDTVKTDTNVEVNASLVNNIRSRLKRSKSERKNKRILQEVPMDDSLVKLFAVKEFALKMGGLENLKYLVSKLEQLAA